MEENQERDSVREEQPQVNWVEEIIKRQSIPLALREGNVEAFCEKYKIKIGEYYYQASKTENQEKMFKKCLTIAKNETPEVLAKLLEKAKAGDMKAIEMFLEYIWKLSKQLDITSGGEKINIINYEQAINIIREGKTGGESDSTE